MRGSLPKPHPRFDINPEGRRRLREVLAKDRKLSQFSGMNRSSFQPFAGIADKTLRIVSTGILVRNTFLRQLGYFSTLF
jgi:hypothetical protein